MHDKLNIIRDFGAYLDESGEAIPATVRTQVVNGVMAEERKDDRAARTRPRSSWRLALVGGAAMALLAVGTLLTARLGDTARPAPGLGNDSEASQVLRQAANVSLLRNDPAPKPGQYTFLESISQYSTAVQQSDGTFKTYERATQVCQVWQDVSGTNAGLARCRPASNPAAQYREFPMDATRGYLEELPTDVGEMRDYLYMHSQGDNPPDMQAFQAGVDLLLGTYLTSGQQAALFGALADIPGISLSQNAIDPAGRRGVAVVMAWNNASSTPTAGGIGRGQAVIFDPVTGEYLGTDRSARLRQSLVDQAGQLPAE